MKTEHGFTEVWMRVGINFHFTDAELEQIKNDTDGSVLSKIVVEHIQGGRAVIGGDVHIPDLDFESNLPDVSITQTGYEPRNTIHLVPVDGNENGRKFCEDYENQIVKDYAEFNEICNKENIQNVESYSMTDFMDLFNNIDGDKDVLDPHKYWLTYTR